MEEIKNKINISFKQLFNLKIHPFFNDKKVNISKNYLEYQKSISNNKIPYQKNEIPKEISVKEKDQKILSDNKLKNLNKKLKEGISFNKILQIVANISNYLIKSNISNYNKLYEKLKNDTDKINICIIGAGPQVIAIYLDKYYNSGTLIRIKS